MPRFSPYIQVIQKHFIIYRYIKNTQAFTIRLYAASCTMPGFCKIKFHTILAIRNGKAEIQFMASETESLEQLPIPSAMNGIIRGTLARLIRAQ